jgi:hypothetical protein
MLSAFPIGRIGMLAGDAAGPEAIEQLLAAADAPQA